MKKIFLVALAVCLLGSSCSTNVSIIGGADGPTNITVSGGLEKNDFSKEPIRIVNVKNELYYETDQDSEEEARCATSDGSFKKCTSEFEIPKEDGGANFSDGDCYQIGKKGGTIEILIDDDWEIFQKIDTEGDVLKYKYCYVVEGKAPNAAVDSEFLVLADSLDVTFSDALYKMMGSDMENMKDIYVLPILD